MNLILYSTGCPKCNVLKKKLDISGLDYKICDNMTDITEICKKKGEMYVPLLQNDEKIMNFIEAITWLKKVGEVK